MEVLRQVLERSHPRNVGGQSTIRRLIGHDLVGTPRTPPVQRYAATGRDPRDLGLSGFRPVVPGRLAAFATARNQAGRPYNERGQTPACVRRWRVSRTRAEKLLNLQAASPHRNPYSGLACFNMPRRNKHGLISRRDPGWNHKVDLRNPSREIRRGPGGQYLRILSAHEY